MPGSAQLLGSFQAWFFIAGARRLGVEAAWQELLSQAYEVNTAEDESQADELWRQRREREPKRLKVEAQQFRMPCDACASLGW